MDMYQKIPNSLLLMVSFLAIAGTALAQEPRGEMEALIPREVFSTPPSYAAPLLSPDGELVSYVTVHEGAMNLWVAAVDDVEKGRPLTAEPRGVQYFDVSGNVIYAWSADGQYLIYHVDEGGDEKFKVKRVRVETGKVETVAAFEGMKTEVVGIEADKPNEILVHANDGNSFHPHEWHRVNMETGEASLVTRTEDYLGMIADHDFKMRVAFTLNELGGLTLHKSSGDGEWEPFIEVGSEDLSAIQNSGYQNAYSFDETNRYFYAYDSRGRNTAALVRYDLETGEEKELARDERVDMGGVLTHPVTSKPIAYATNWTRTQWHALDESIAEDFEKVVTVADGDFRIVSQTRDNQKWLVQYMLSDKPIAYYVYDRATKKATKLFVSTPQLEGLTLSKLHPVVIKSRDGFDLVSYLMLPRWSDPDGNGIPCEPVPMILLVHGGPGDERAQFAFGPILHQLANRGYATLYVNFRGSPGFGKAFMNAARYEWGGKMHNDLIDQVNWMVEKGIADEDKVALFGGSYGGYATLVGMTMTPDVFACGIDIVGPSSLEIPMPHWTPESMAGSVGDPRTEEGRALLKARSPINFAHQTKNPVLVGQGANDSRVPQEQSDKLVEIMKDNGVKVTYMLFPDEGHGWLRPQNQLASDAIIENFLAQHLGGRAQPITNELEDSSVLVPVGAAQISGLEEALSARAK
jgi:dipeptidyl aminopeptidase/acylaminoacyl peptidase